MLACDMRFASKEKAILAQPEVGFGVVPGGGGGLDWLPRVAGRSRALEIITGGQDFDGDTAERYGLVNRALPDAQLDSFVDALATRIGGFERRALATAKRIVNERSPVPAEGELLQSFRAILEAITWPEAHARMAAMRAKGWGTVSDGELNHPGHLGVLTSELAAPGPAPPAGPLGTCPASERSPAAGQSRVSCALRDAWLISFGINCREECVHCRMIFSVTELPEQDFTAQKETTRPSSKPIAPDGLIWSASGEAAAAQRPNHPSAIGYWPGPATGCPASLKTGSSQDTVVPPPAGLCTEKVPPSASIRSFSPTSPEPRSGSAPPTPSSRTHTRSVPPETPASTSATDAGRAWSRS